MCWDKRDEQKGRQLTDCLVHHWQSLIDDILTSHAFADALGHERGQGNAIPVETKSLAVYRCSRVRMWETRGEGG